MDENWGCCWLDEMACWGGVLGVGTYNRRSTVRQTGTWTESGGGLVQQAKPHWRRWSRTWKGIGHGAAQQD